MPVASSSVPAPSDFAEQISSLLEPPPDFHEPPRSFPAPPPLPPAAAHPLGTCSVCGATPAATGTFVAVRSYIVFFKRARREGSWCRDCALTQFRETQYICMTRGWWGFVYCPLFNLISIIGNVNAWNRFKGMAPVLRTVPALAPAKPVRRRPLAYVATALAAAIVVALLVTPTGDGGTVPTAVRHATGPTHDHFKPLIEFLAASPSGWRLNGGDGTMSIQELSKDFKKPSLVESHLATDGYLRGVYRGYVQSTPRKVVILELWQFATPSGAEAFYDEFVRGNASSTNSVYRSDFSAPNEGHGFLATRRDKFGFSYGVGVRRIGDLIVHVRFSALSAVTMVDVRGALEWTSAAVTLVSTA